MVTDPSVSAGLSPRSGVPSPGAAPRFATEALPHLDALYRFALRFSGARADAQDLVQDTILKALTAWDQFEPGTNARAWLMTILRNQFVSGYRKRRRAGRRLGLDAPDPQRAEALVGPDDPEASVVSQEVDRRVTDGIDALPQHYRAPLVLSDADGLGYADVARVLGIPVGTVRSRLFRARRLVRARVRDYAAAAGYLRPERDEATASGRCRAARRLLLDFIEGKVTPRVAVRIRKHLEVCCACRSCSEFERQYLAMVESALQRQRCPESVRREILRSISREGACCTAGSRP